MYERRSGLERVRGSAHFTLRQLASLQDTMDVEARHSRRRLGGAKTYRGLLLASHPNPSVDLDLTHIPLEDKGKNTAPLRLTAIDPNNGNAIITSYLTDGNPRFREDEGVDRFAFAVDTQVRGALRWGQSVWIYFAPDNADPQEARRLLLSAAGERQIGVYELQQDILGDRANNIGLNVLG